MAGILNRQQRTVTMNTINEETMDKLINLYDGTYYDEEQTAAVAAELKAAGIEYVLWKECCTTIPDVIAAGSAKTVVEALEREVEKLGEDGDVSDYSITDVYGDAVGNIPGAYYGVVIADATCDGVFYREDADEDDEGDWTEVVSVRGYRVLTDNRHPLVPEHFSFDMFDRAEEEVRKAFESWHKAVGAPAGQLITCERTRENCDFCVTVI